MTMKPTDLVSDERIREIANNRPSNVSADMTLDEIVSEHIAMAHEIASVRQALRLREHNDIGRSADALERIAAALEGATSIANAAEAAPERASPLDDLWKRLDACREAPGTKVEFSYEAVDALLRAFALPSEHPMQPIIKVDGAVRFKPNAVVARLSDEKLINLNQIATWDMPVADMEQFWQMLGYTVAGYGNLSFVRKETIAKADRIADELFSHAKKAP